MINRRALIAAAASMSVLLAAPAALAEDMAGTRSGTFEGRSNHETKGSVRIIEEGGRTFVELGDDFGLDSGPDPRVNLGNDGMHDADAYLGALLSLNGKQRYAVPSTWDANDYGEVYIWCEVAGVPLGVASLK